MASRQEKSRSHNQDNRSGPPTGAPGGRSSLRGRSARARDTPPMERPSRETVHGGLLVPLGNRPKPHRSNRINTYENRRPLRLRPPRRTLRLRTEERLGRAQVNRNCARWIPRWLASGCVQASHLAPIPPRTVRKKCADHAQIARRSCARNTLALVDGGSADVWPQGKKSGCPQARSSKGTTLGPAEPRPEGASER